MDSVFLANFGLVEVDRYRLRKVVQQFSKSRPKVVPTVVRAHGGQPVSFYRVLFVLFVLLIFYIFTCILFAIFNILFLFLKSPPSFIKPEPCTAIPLSLSVGSITSRRNPKLPIDNDDVPWPHCLQVRERRVVDRDRTGTRVGVESVEVGKKEMGEELERDFDEVFNVLAHDSVEDTAAGPSTGLDDHQVGVKIEPTAEAQAPVPKGVLEEQAKAAQGAIQQIRTARRAFDTADIDFGLNVDKATGHKYVSADMLAEFKTCIDACRAIDVVLLDADKAWRIHSKVDVATAKTATKQMMDCINSAKVLEKKIKDLIKE